METMEMTQEQRDAAIDQLKVEIFGNLGYLVNLRKQTESCPEVFPELRNNRNLTNLLDTFQKLQAVRGW